VGNAQPLPGRSQQSAVPQGLHSRRHGLQHTRWRGAPSPQPREFQEVSADVAKAVLMERYHALRENLEKERLEAGMPPIDEEWNVYADGEQPALSEDEPDSDQLFDLDLPAPAAGDEISTGAASALAIDAPQPAAVELDLNHLPGDDPEPASPNTDQGAPA
jgi:hypothetical protein